MKIMNHTITGAVFLILVASLSAQVGETKPSFGEAAAGLQMRLEESLLELSKLREEIGSEQIPLATELARLETELIAARQEYQQQSRVLDGKTQDLINLTTEIKKNKEEASYLSKLFGDYIREFEAGLHIAELKRYSSELSAAKLATENNQLSEAEQFEVQIATITTAMNRLDDVLGGSRFEGSAVDKDGTVREGSMLLLGPAALFASKDGDEVGTVEQKIGSLEASVTAFMRPEDRKLARTLVTSGAGQFPLDPTLGNAHKMAATEETLIEHVKKGGPVMWPIFIMAGLGLLIAVYKWLSFLLVRRPSRRQIAALLESVAARDQEAAMAKAKKMRGPVGRMLAAGAAHIHEPRELIEEIMYETLLKTKLRLEQLLPFIAICAASAPLLGLLGTVTGIINTFKMITVFGSGDVKSLSGGISEALITTKFGLIVAIPSLLLHAFLSRKAKGIVAQMESAGVAFVNEVSKSPKPGDSLGDRDSFDRMPADKVSSEDMKQHVHVALKELLGSNYSENGAQSRGTRESGLAGEAHA